MINKNLIIRSQTSIILLILIYLMILSNFISTYVLIILGVISFIEFAQITKKILKKKLLRHLFNTIFIIYLSIFCYLFYFFSYLDYLKIILYIILFGCVASDIGGYIVGKIFKGPKLIKISPNKTFSGAIGSIIFTCLLITLLTFIFTNNFSFLIIILSIIVSLSCQVGDLFFSFLKRKARVKDTGSFFPGHGGVLDRVDSILFGLPFGFISLIILH